MYSWISNFVNWLLHKPKPVQRQTPGDDRLDECVAWLTARPNGKHYVACRLLATAQDLQRRFPTATILTIPRMTTGWSTVDANAYLCCTATLRPGPVATQLGGRLRFDNAAQNTLLYLN